MNNRDWWEWHRPYDDPGSPLSQRLASVQSHLRMALDRCPAGRIQVISICAGQARDLIPVAAAHPRRGDVRGRLVELDPRNIAHAERNAAELGGQVDVVRADAGITDAYVGAVPAHIVLACGIFGNITEEDIERTVRTLPTLCAPGAIVIWTRHRRPPDLTPTVRGWFEAAGFVEEAFEAPDDRVYGVGVNRLEGAPMAFEPHRRMFTFIGYDHLATSEEPLRLEAGR